MGILDPIKVTGAALQGSFHCRLMLTTEAMVPELPKKDGPMGGGPGGGLRPAHRLQ